MSSFLGWSGLGSSSGPDNLSPGLMCWLPRRSDIPNYLLRGCSINEGCFHHPFLVVDVDDATQSVDGFIVTSFGGKQIMQKHPTNAYIRFHHLPISPSPIHPDLGVQLSLEGGLQLRKNSYINLGSRIRVNFGVLAGYAYDGQIFRLQADSLTCLRLHEDTCRPGSLLASIQKSGHARDCLYQAQLCNMILNPQAPDFCKAEVPGTLLNPRASDFVCKAEMPAAFWNPLASAFVF